MEELKTIKLDCLGNSLGSRELGREFRDKAISFLKEGHKVIFDFSGVTVISSAFADELFGKLFNELGEEAFKNKIMINNFSNEESKKLIVLIINKTINFRKTTPSLQ